MKTNNHINYDNALSIVKKTKLSCEGSKFTGGRKLKVYWPSKVRGLHELLNSMADRVIITDRFGPYGSVGVVSYYFYNR